MDERQDEPIHVVTEREFETERSHTNLWLAAGTVVLALAVGVFGGYVYHAQKYDKADTARDAQMQSTVSQLQGQIDSLKTQLDQASATPAAPAPGGAAWGCGGCIAASGTR